MQKKIRACGVSFLSTNSHVTATQQVIEINEGKEDKNERDKKNEWK